MKLAQPCSGWHGCQPAVVTNACIISRLRVRPGMGKTVASLAQDGWQLQKHLCYWGHQEQGWMCGVVTHN
jgi:hypothetical protein